MIQKETLYVTYVNKVLTRFLQAYNVQIESVDVDTDGMGVWNGGMKVEVFGRPFELEIVREFVKELNIEQGGY